MCNPFKVGDVVKRKCGERKYVLEGVITGISGNFLYFNNDDPPLGWLFTRYELVVSTPSKAVETFDINWPHGWKFKSGEYEVLEIQPLKFGDYAVLYTHPDWFKEGRTALVHYTLDSLKSLLVNKPKPVVKEKRWAVGFEYIVQSGGMEWC